MMKQRCSTALILAGLVCLLLSLSISALAAPITGSVNADKVFFRMQANTDSDFHARLNKGTVLSILNVKGDFYQVKYDGKSGYVMKKFVTLSSSAQAALNKQLTPVSTSKFAKAASIRALGEAPRASKPGDKSMDVEKLQRALQLKKCYTGVVDGGYGPKTQEAVKLFQQKNGLKVTGTADVATILKLFGGVAETTAANDPQMKGISRIADIKVPNTTKKGDRGQHVKALQQALKIKGFYKAAIDSGYGDKTVAAVTAYQKSVGLSADGVAGNGTIRRLFGKPAANYTIKTERLEWFANAGTIPKGAIFTIKDIATGRTFSVKRWSGANHLDAEPLTAKDTQALKDIFGGGWSWDRRSVLVKYNDHVYAASINGMPHGTTTIDNNKFDGHICVHFHNSKTHDTNRVDQAHQNAVSRAMNASW